MLIFSITGLCLVVALGVLAVFSGHIPWLARLLGAEPLQPAEPEPPDTAEIFAASKARGYVTPVDWGDDTPQPRLELTTPKEKDR